MALTKRFKKRKNKSKKRFKKSRMRGGNVEELNNEIEAWNNSAENQTDPSAGCSLFYKVGPIWSNKCAKAKPPLLSNTPLTGAQSLLSSGTQLPMAPPLRLNPSQGAPMRPLNLLNLPKPKPKSNSPNPNRAKRGLVDDMRSAASPEYSDYDDIEENLKREMADNKFLQQAAAARMEANRPIDPDQLQYFGGHRKSRKLRKSKKKKITRKRSKKQYH